MSAETAVQSANHPAASSLDDKDGEVHAAVYARTSSSSQRFGYSIDEQVHQCWQHVEDVGWTVTHVFTDEAESGRDTERPQFQKMLQMAEAGVIDVVTFWKLDRFCRSLVDLVNIEEQLNDWDVALQSVTEYIDTTSPVGRFNFRNLASAAELESDLTSQRAKMGMHGLARDHKWPNERPPLGYDKVDDGRLEVNEKEAALVRRIFRLYLKERSMPQVAHVLNEEGVRTKTGEEWCRQSIKQVLANELYVGEYRVAGFEDTVEEYRLMPDDLFKAVTGTRFRFQHEKGRMDKDRKASKATRIFNHYRDVRGAFS